MVPVDALALIITHPGEEYSPRLRLLDDVLNNLRPPVIVLPVVHGIPADSYCPGRTEERAAMAANTVLLMAPHLVILGIVVVNIERALVDAHLTLDTPFRVSFY